MTIAQQATDRVQQIRPIQFIAVGKQTRVPAPLVRVTTCGLLTLETVQELVSTDPPLARYASLTPEQQRGRGTAPALLLLKLLLSRPQRYAPRDWLMEQLCQDRELLSPARLDNLAWLLRKLICLPDYAQLRTHLVAHVQNSSGSGNGYQLAPYPLIWVDSEALAWNVEQAVRMERFGDDPLPLWERAYELAKRGSYLPDELYSDWAESRRGEVAGMLRQSVLALARLYQERHGTAGEEEALLVLRSYWQEHPREEDALRPLMELLGKRECYQEALEYYEKLRMLLEEEDGEPDTRTQDLAEYVRTKLIQRPPRSMIASEREEKSLSQKLGLLSPLVTYQEEGNNSPYNEELQKKFLNVHSLETGIAIMKESRRHLLQQILSVTGSLIAKPHILFENSLPEEILSFATQWTKADNISLSHLEAITRNYWNLFNFVSSKQELLPALAGHLQTILRFLRAPHPGATRNRLYALASESALITGIILFDMQDYHYASTYYRFAIAAAKEAGNNALRAVGLGRLSFLPIYAHQSQQALPLLQEAKELLATSLPYPVIRCWLALIEAEASAHLHDEITCESALDLAITIHEQQGQEEETLWTQINDASIPGYQGACYLQLQKTRKALGTLQDTLHHLHNHAHRHRSIILTDMATAMVQMGEIEEACRFLRQALEITIRTRSLMVILRMQQVRDSLEEWKETSAVREVDEMIGESAPHLFLAP